MAEAVHPLRIAHRSYRDAGKGNTIADIRRAIGLGADAIELDVRRRRDGCLVLHHDDANRPDAPTLEEALVVARESDVLLDLDLKVDGLGIDVAEIVSRLSIARRVVCTGTQWDDVARVRSGAPGSRAGVTVPRKGSGLLVQASVRATERARLLRRLDSIARAFSPDIVALNHHLASRRVVERVHALGAHVWVWTVDDPRDLDRVISLGVDGICSDRPVSHGLA